VIYFEWMHVLKTCFLYTGHYARKRLAHQIGYDQDRLEQSNDSVCMSASVYITSYI